MDIQSLPNQQSVQQIDSNALALRLNQRVRAQVLQVLGEQVLLDVNGTQVVARVVGPDIAALLNQGAQAQFVVAGLHEGAVTLKLLNSEQNTEQVPSTALLIGNLLKSLGIQNSGINNEIARALLSQKMELSPQLFAEMQELLAQLPNWMPKDADFAAALKAAGLPLTLDTLALAKQDVSHLGQLLAELQNDLGKLALSASQTEQGALARLVVDSLAQLPVDWGSAPEEVAERLQTLLSLLGRTAENALSESLSETKPENLILTLLRLSQVLSRKGNTNSVNQLTELMNSLRAMQLNNATWQTDAPIPQWLAFSLPLVETEQPQNARTAHLRIAYDQDGEGRFVNPKQTRLVLQVDLDNDEYIQVDVSIVDKQMGAQVHASSDELIGLAQTEFSTLEDGLAGLGFTLNKPHYLVKAHTGDPGSSTRNSPLFDRLGDWEA